MSHIAFPIVWAIGLIVFAAIIAGRARLLLAAQPAGRLDRIPERLWRAVVYGLGQQKFLAGDQPAGIMHALIFWGFLVLMIQVITLFVRAFDADWSLPGFGENELLGLAVRPSHATRSRCSCRRRCLHALPAPDRPHPAPVRPTPRRAALPDEAALGGRADPPLHPLHRRRRAPVRPRLVRGGRGWWRCTTRRTGVPVPAAPVQALPHHHGDPEPVLRQAAAARVRAAAGDHARAGRARGGARPPGGRACRRRLARRSELEAGARRVHVHRVRSLHRGLPGHCRAARRWRRGSSSSISATSCTTATGTSR